MMFYGELLERELADATSDEAPVEHNRDEGKEKPLDLQAIGPVKEKVLSVGNLAPLNSPAQNQQLVNLMSDLNKLNAKGATAGRVPQLGDTIIYVSGGSALYRQRGMLEPTIGKDTSAENNIALTPGARNALFDKAANAIFPSGQKKGEKVFPNLDKSKTFFLFDSHASTIF